jgi:hypothetical protein
MFNDHIIKFTDYSPIILYNENNSIELKPGEAIFDKKNQILKIKCKVILITKNIVMKNLTELSLKGRFSCI